MNPVLAFLIGFIVGVVFAGVTAVIVVTYQVSKIFENLW